MKKLKYLVVTLFLMFIPFAVNAASGSISISGSSTAVVGNQVKYTVTLSGAGIASWQAQLNYDSSYLQLVGATTEAGGNYMVNTIQGKPGRSYTFTFKTLKSGSTTLSIGSNLVYADDFSQMSMSAGSKQVKIITQAELEASYSKDNSLRNLSVEGYEISPEFKKDVSEYKLNVPEGTEKINVIAQVNDGTASVSGAGEVELTPGSNTINIVVRAQNGSERTYTLLVDVIDENPIEVTVDNTEYTVVKLASNITCPSLYKDKEIIIGEVKIPGCYNDKIKYTLVGLKDTNGKIALFRFNDGKYYSYSEIKAGSLSIIAYDDIEVIKGYKLSNIKVGDVKVNCLTVSDKSRTKLIYGINIETGEEGYFVYDEKTHSLTVYDDEIVATYEEKSRMLMCAAGIFLVTTALSLISTLCVLKSKKKLSKKVREMMEKDTTSSQDEEEIIVQEEVSSETSEDISEIIAKEMELDKPEKSKKKKKKKKRDKFDFDSFEEDEDENQIIEKK